MNHEYTRLVFSRTRKKISIILLRLFSHLATLLNVWAWKKGTWWWNIPPWNEFSCLFSTPKKTLQVSKIKEGQRVKIESMPSFILWALSRIQGITLQTSKFKCVSIHKNFLNNHDNKTWDKLLEFIKPTRNEKYCSKCRIS